MKKEDMTDFFTFILLLNIFSIRRSTAFDLTENVALSCSTMQSSTLNESTESVLAVDGDASTVNCAETDYEENPWWMVDLGSMFYVYRITVVYGGNIAALSGLHVSMTNNPPSLSSAPSQFPVRSSVNQSLLPPLFPSPANGTGGNPPVVGIKLSVLAALNATPARYVVVVLEAKNESLRLCEVTVQPNRIRGSLWSASNGVRMSVCIYSSSLSSSAVECGLRCLPDINCLSFNHRKADGVCELINCQPGSDVAWNYVIDDASFGWYNQGSYWRKL